MNFNCRIQRIIRRKMYHQSLSKVVPTKNPEAVQLASNLLKSGEVIAVPTDTIYGLTCSANDPEAIKKLYKIKGRNEEKPVAICVSDFSDLRHWGCADHLSNQLIAQLLPGPVTIVLDKSEHLNNPFINPGVSKIGIRIPDFAFIRNVCRAFNQPMALTSANLSSERSALNISEFSHLWGKLGCVFDGGCLSEAESHRLGSTVIDLSETNRCKVIREGINFKATIELLKKFDIITE
ncbi:CLUMA_CG007555, isoform A [Clunio marinus]|uniref:Threonylcarbamoyl-AMP synthase n=1 Tax=Clunio marinus TaxID=568069 RepID=A0A1J1I108_9DIPT|nr:CLUMA_CG007555, isoform A [Clunio marinus]